MIFIVSLLGNFTTSEAASINVRLPVNPIKNGGARLYGLTTPDEHDRDVARIQSLTHLVANLFVKMNVQRTGMTTRSFELMMSAVDMVRHDAPEVFQAIVTANPYAADVLKRFKSLVPALDEPV